VSSRRLFRDWSLGARMVAMFSVLLAAIGVFILVFFPARMADQARVDAVARAESIARVMSTALGPALEFDDPDNALAILGWLASTRDARFGIVSGADDRRVAVWKPAAIPPSLVWHNVFRLESIGELLVVSTPIQALGGGQGTLHLGFSLHHLQSTRDGIRREVALTTAVLFVIGVLLTMLLAAFIVRPIRTLTRTALQISRGELPAELPTVAGDHEVVRLADALRAMLERIHEVSQRELMSASRQAGMAEVATGVLHNVGNVLTSVNVSVELLHERSSGLPVERLRKLHDLLAASVVGDKVDPARLATAIKYVAVVTTSVEEIRDQIVRDVGVLSGHIDHIKRVVSMQNAYARMRTVVEATSVASLLHEAVEIACPSQRRPDITTAIEVAGLLDDDVMIDRHRVLQIVVNLISNARDAVSGIAGPRLITVEATSDGAQVTVEVRDSGVGITKALLARIFNAGFTSKQGGHGYGLHSSALAARQMGGALTVSSEGEGHGATFTLVVPIAEQRS
jgi:signal transduction histidine kinase